MRLTVCYIIVVLIVLLVVLIVAVIVTVLLIVVWKRHWQCGIDNDAGSVEYTGSGIAESADSGSDSDSIINNSGLVMALALWD